MSIVNWFVVFLVVCLVVGVALVVRRIAHHPYESDGRMVDTVKLARIASIATWLWLATDVAVMLASIGTINALGGFGSPMASAHALRSADAFTSATSLAYSVSTVAAGCVVLRWVYLTNRNAHALYPAMTVTPGWAVAWFFIPIAGLWKPFDGVRQTWQASADPKAPDTVPIPALLRWWWGLWVVTSIMGNIEYSLSSRANTVEGMIGANLFTLATLPVDIGLAIALTTMMRRPSQMQRDVAGGAAHPRPKTAEDDAVD
ncbi:DUF4328 domain-containing protein [Sphingomonas sp. M1A8_2b]